MNFCLHECSNSFEAGRWLARVFLIVGNCDNYRIGYLRIELLFTANSKILLALKLSVFQDVSCSQTQISSGPTHKTRKYSYSINLSCNDAISNRKPGFLSRQRSCYIFSFPFKSHAPLNLQGSVKSHLLLLRFSSFLL